MATIHFTADFDYFHHLDGDGWRVTAYRAGQVYEVDDAVALVAVEAYRAVYVTQEADEHDHQDADDEHGED